MRGLGRLLWQPMLLAAGMRFLIGLGLQDETVVVTKTMVAICGHSPRVLVRNAADEG